MVSNENYTYFIDLKIERNPSSCKKIPVRNAPTQEMYHSVPSFNRRREELRRLHGALNATGPDLVCNNTVRARSIVDPPRPPPRSPARTLTALDCAPMITNNKTPQSLARRADRLFCVAVRIHRCTYMYVYMNHTRSWTAR